MLYITLKKEQSFTHKDKNGIPKSVVVPKGKYKAKLEDHWVSWNYEGKEVGAAICFIRRRSTPDWSDSQIVLSEE